MMPRRVKRADACLSKAAISRFDGRLREAVPLADFLVSLSLAVVVDVVAA